jgi:polyisoprenyl-phosphate glycosyltransferase
MFKLSIIVSVFNEEQVLEFFFNELQLNISEFEYEVIFINDGSTDNTSSILNSFTEKNFRVKVIHLSRNFGHEAAMIAGIDHACGDAIICMDADLQHPPQMISQMVSKFNSGYEIITMIRKSNADSGFFKSYLSKAFYSFLNKISDIQFDPCASDFFLISSRVADILRTNYRETNRYMRGIIQSIGFKKQPIPFDAPTRFAGESKYTYRKLISFSFTAIINNSITPLRIGILLGTVFGLISVVLAIFSIVMKFIGNPVGGYSTLIVFISFAFGLHFFLLGFIGEYIGNIFKQTRNRPIYLIDSISKQNE